MNRDEFETFLDDTYGELIDLNASKGHDYAGDENVFANFDRGAEKYGLTREQVLGIFLSKHLDAIDTFIREGQVESEPIEGRIHDAVMYLLLLLGMVSETSSDGFTEPPGTRTPKAPLLKRETPLSPGNEAS